MGELSTRMTALEETYWHVHCADKPLPTQQIIMHLAQIAQYIQNTNVSDKKDRGVLTDFMLFFKKRQTPQKNVDQEILNVFGKLKKQDK